MVKVNGETVDIAGKTVAEYLEDAGYSMTRIAVEKNGDIVPKASYDTEVIEDGDVFEIVGFVGGG